MEEKKSGKQAARQYVIPVSRVNTIMKSSSDVENVSKESSAIMSKAAEMFIKALSIEGFNDAYKSQSKRLDYKNLANVVHSDEKYNFLRDILPKKITVLQFKQIMARKQAAENRSDDNNDSTSSDDDSSSSAGDSSGSTSE